MRGPNGEKRPANTFDNGFLVGRILAGEAREERVDDARSRAGKLGAEARARRGVKPGETMAADGEGEYR